jgi:hypothetical protein
MIELYAQIKWLHVAAVIASGLFVLRGVAVQACAVWPMAARFRYPSYRRKIGGAEHAAWAVRRAA